MSPDVRIAAAGDEFCEVSDAHRSGTGWAAGSSALFDRTSNSLRPAAPRATIVGE